MVFRYALPTILVFLSCAHRSAVAQCPFAPTVAPDDLILCPNEQGTLTTQVYDSYQWYKAGQPIAGETGPTLTVDAFNDAPYNFKVEATLDGCTEMSPEILVDGWAFLLPFVMTSDNYLFIDAGTAVFCEGDTARLILMPPYDINIQWTNNGVPIPGATDDTLMILEPGNFHVSGAPSICPNFIQQLGVTVPIDFQAPIQPVITMSDNSLCASPEGLAYQWYLDGVPIQGNTSCIMATSVGVYTVDVNYDPDCSILSEGVATNSIEDPISSPRFDVMPLPASDRLTVTARGNSVIGSWQLLDATGRAVMRGDGLRRTSATIDVSALGIGTYRLLAADGPARPVVIMR